MIILFYFTSSYCFKLFFILFYLPTPYRYQLLLIFCSSQSTHLSANHLTSVFRPFFPKCPLPNFASSTTYFTFELLYFHIIHLFPLLFYHLRLMVLVCLL